MDARPLVVAAHGILTKQTDASWPDRLAAEWDAWATVLRKEYSAGPWPLWNRHVKNPRLARGLAAEVTLFKGRKIYMVGHSNGTDVVLGAIKLLAAQGIRTEAAVLIGSVLPSDVHQNGVHALVKSGLLGRAVAWSSEHDRAIAWGRHSWGYGGLGCEGWRSNGLRYARAVEAGGREYGLLGKSVDTPPPGTTLDIRTRWWPGFGHSEYFIWPHIAGTFATLAQDLGLD